MSTTAQISDERFRVPVGGGGDARFELEVRVQQRKQHKYNTGDTTAENNTSGFEDETLIMINGKSGTLGMWSGLDERLVQQSTGLRVVTYDQRDMGRSSRSKLASSNGGDGEAAKEQLGLYHARQQQADDGFTADDDSYYEGPGYTIETLANDCIAVLDAVGVSGPAHVLGASMGGLTAQDVATWFGPGRVRSLTCIMTAADLNRWAGQAFVANMEMFLAIMGVPAPAPGMTREEFLANRFEVWEYFLRDDAHDGLLSAVERDRFLRAMGSEWDRGAVDWHDAGGNCQMLATNKFSTPANLAKHAERLRSMDAIPTLVLHGSHDPIIPIAGGRELSQLIPNSKFETYRGGHNLPLGPQPMLVDSILAQIRGAMRGD